MSNAVSSFIIDVSQDIEAPEFKENFFYHFDKRETLSITVALIFGGAVYIALNGSGLSSEIVTVLMAMACILPLLIGFYKDQGYGFFDTLRNRLMVKAFDEMYFESTEDFGKIIDCKGRSKGIIELDKKDIKEG